MRVTKMRNYITQASRALLVGALLVTGLTISAPDAHATGGKKVARFSAMYTAIDGSVILLPSTSTPASSPIEIYNNTIKIPNRSYNVVYVTIHASAFGFGQGIALNCQVDGIDCLNGTGTAGPGSVAAIPPGWVIPLGSEFTGSSGFGATGLSYEWCAPLSKTNKAMHTITINAADAFGTGDDWMEAVGVYIDANKVKEGADACSTYATPNPDTSPDIAVH